MAVVRPFRAILPAHTPGEDVSNRTAPPYDVISPEQRETLIGLSPHNVVALELPEGPLSEDAPGNRYATGAARWREWIADGELVQDETEAVYVLEQRFDLDGREIRRRCLIAAVELEPFEAGVVLPHERTLPKALDDRLRMLRATNANLSQVFSMYSDPAGTTNTFFDDAMAQEPLMRATDADDVVSTVWAIRDPETLEALAGALADSRIFIADGHHRYTTALAYRDEQQARGASGSVMMALVNMDDPNLVVLPTHRVARRCGGLRPHCLPRGPRVPLRPHRR